MACKVWLRFIIGLGVFAAASAAALADDTKTYTYTLPAVNVPLNGTDSGVIQVTPFNTSLGTLESTSVSIATTYDYGGSVTANAPVTSPGLTQLTGTTATYDLSNYGILAPLTSSSAALAECPCSQGTFGDNGSITKTVSASSATNVPPLPGGNIDYTFKFSNVAPAPWTVNLTNSLSATVTVTDTYVPLPQVKPQEVYLDFSANPDADYKGYIYNKPSAGVFAANANAITAEVQSAYSTYNVQFTDTKPTSGAYDTIYVGGTSSNLPGLSLPAGLQGQAQEINLGDNVKGGLSAIALSGSSYFSSTGAIEAVCVASGGSICDISPSDRLAQVIEHETGHLLGLVHVVDPSQLMYPDPTTPGYGDPTKIGGPAYVAVGGYPPLTANYAWLEDSNAILGCNVGFSATGATDCGSVNSKGVYYANGSGNVTTSILLGTSLSNSVAYQAIYDASLVDGTFSDSDSGPLSDYIGTLFPGTSYTIDFPLALGDDIFLEGDLTPNGKIQIFSLDFADNGSDIYVLEDVPEPKSIAIFAMGLLCLSYLLHMKRKGANR